jgi:hypothetical protein
MRRHGSTGARPLSLQLETDLPRLWADNAKAAVPGACIVEGLVAKPHLTIYPTLFWTTNGQSDRPVAGAIPIRYEVLGLPFNISASVVPHHDAWAIIGTTAVQLLAGRFVFKSPHAAALALEAALVRAGCSTADPASHFDRLLSP